MESRLTQLEMVNLSEFNHYRPADRRVDEKEGKRDGHHERSPSDDVRHPFRERIITAAQAALRKYHHRLDNYIDELSKRERSLRQDLDERYATTRDRFDTAVKDRNDRIEHTIGPTSSRSNALRETHQRSVDRERQIEADVGRPLRIHLRNWYALIMAFVALVEIPINRFAFELYFAETPALSFLIALGVGIALMFLAHFAGTWLTRSFGASTVGHKVSYGVGIAITAALILPTVYLIALLRQHYVHFVEAQNVSFRELLEARGFEDVARDVITTDLGTSGLMLLMINLLVVGIAVIVAVARHDSHPDYEHAVLTRERAERKYSRLQARYDKETGKAKKAHDVQIGTLDKQRERLDKDLGEVEAAKNACEAHKEQMFQRVVLHLRQRLQAYEEGYERARSSPRPKTFGGHDEENIRKSLLEGLSTPPDRGAAGDSTVRAVQ